MNMYLKRIIFLTFLAHLGLVANLWAATFYVDTAHPDASDSNAGTESKPWKTIQRGADIAVAGDTVYVKDGVYYEAVKMRRSGSSGKYITFRNYPGHNPAVDGSKINDEKLVWWYSDGVRKNYIEWDGIDVRNSKKNGMWVVGTHNIIRNSKIHHNGTPNSTGHTGLQTTYTDNIIISNNEIYNNGWNGLSVENTSYAIIESNIVRDNSDHAGINVFPSPGLSQSSQVANHIRSNLIYNNGTGIYSRYQFNNEISNNLIHSNKDGGIFFHTESSGSSDYNSYTKIYNNTIAANGWQSIVSQGASYLTITNNIITSTSISLSGSGHSITDNLFYGTSASGSNTIIGDPLFVNSSSGDYSLASTSPAIDKGKDLTNEGITRDIIDKSRPQANGFEIGAYEYGDVSTKSLKALAITGPESITESSSGTYTATATWSDDSTSTVTPLWAENSEYATISTGGVLATTSVTADQTVNVSASYTSGDTAKTAATSVVITDFSTEVPPDSVKPSLESTTSPMQAVSAPNDPVDSYIETTTSNSGSAVYSFNIDQAGLYKIVAMVYAADSASDSFVVKIDDGLENTWDMNPEGDPNLYGVWREDEVTARGTGTFDAPQFDPWTVELEAGTHTITFIGRESNARLAYSYLMMVAADSTPPSTETSPAEGEASPLLLFRAEAGELTAETMEIVSSLDIPGGSYITPTSSTSSSAVYNFNLDQPGRYKIVAEVFAADNASDSFQVKIDDGLEDTWDMNPEGDPGQYGVWRQDEVTARGSGTFDAPQFDPLKLQLAAGNHTISITGRELNSRLAYFYLIRVPAGTELIEAESGTLTEPMLVVLGTEASGGAYVETSTRDSGSAVYSFDIAEPANYKVVARTYSADAGSDSFKVKIDDGAEDIWDLNPKEDPALYNVWRQAEVTARGTGTFDNPQYVPLTVPLEAGKHTITFSGRETNTALDNVYLMQITTTTEPSIIKLEIE